jgi:hypothetical protein
MKGLPTIQHLFLPGPHLVISQAVLLELVTELEQVLAHSLHMISTEQTAIRG